MQSEDISQKETTVNGFSAIQYDSDFISSQLGQELHLSVMVAKGEEYYIIITILCDKNSYIDDRNQSVLQCYRHYRRAR